MRKLTYILILGLNIFLFSCKQETATPCEQVKSASALIQDFPDSLKVGTAFPVTVNYILENDCGDFDHFDISQNGKSFVVTLMTKYTGCSCKLELIERQTNFDIDVDFPGNYEFSFSLEDGDLDTYSLVVYE